MLRVLGIFLLVAMPWTFLLATELTGEFVFLDPQKAPDGVYWEDAVLYSTELDTYHEGQNDDKILANQKRIMRRLAWIAYLRKYQFMGLNLVELTIAIHGDSDKRCTVYPVDTPAKEAWIRASLPLSLRQLRNLKSLLKYDACLSGPHCSEARKDLNRIVEEDRELIRVYPPSWWYFFFSGCMEVEF